MSLEIKAENYLVQDAEICRAQLAESSDSNIGVSILLFQDYVFKFDTRNKRIGLLKILNDQGSHEVII